MVNFRMSDLEYSFLAIGKDITRPHLQNVLLSETGSVCTDGHRLHRVGVVGDKTCLLPLEGYMMVKAFGGKDASIQYSKGAISHVVKIISGDLTIYHNICEDQFPPYEQVIPKYNDASIDFDTKKLFSALESLKKISKGDRIAGIAINIESARSGTVNIRYKNGDVELSIDIPCKMKSDDDYDTQEIGLRICYLMDAIRKKEKTTRILLSRALDPIVVKYDDSIAVIMPMRI
jgi:DNA polymerase III sliding clamp (beta) subunit (PCNA family)